MGNPIPIKCEIRLGSSLRPVNATRAPLVAAGRVSGA